jgi:PPM family protein phosphatase
VRVAAGSDVGRQRSQNEDAWEIVRRHSGKTAGLVVADGMGGHEAGEVASRMAVETMTQTIRSCATLNCCLEDAEQLLRDGLEEANRRIMEYSELHLRGVSSGTTLTAAYLDGPMLILIHIGDSRAYLYREGMLRQISQDHTWVAELVATGAINEGEAREHPERNKITRALGFDTGMKPQLVWERLRKGDRLLLCTDGLTEYLGEQELAHVLEKHAPTDAVSMLVEAANGRGGRDNITVIVAAIEPEDLT